MNGLPHPVHTCLYPYRRVSGLTFTRFFTLKLGYWSLEKSGATSYPIAGQVIGEQFFLTIEAVALLD